MNRAALGPSEIVPTCQFLAAREEPIRFALPRQWARGQGQPHLDSFIFTLRPPPAATLE